MEWPSTWTVEADLGEGGVLSAPVHVMPEPDAVLAGLAAAALLGVRAAGSRRARAPRSPRASLATDGARDG